VCEQTHTNKQTNATDQYASGNFHLMKFRRAVNKHYQSVVCVNVVIGSSIHECVVAMVVLHDISQVPSVMYILFLVTYKTSSFDVTECSECNQEMISEFLLSVSLHELIECSICNAREASKGHNVLTA